MTQVRYTRTCAQCGTTDDEYNFFWMSYANFCGPCMDKFVDQGWAIDPRTPGYRRHFRLTEQGAIALPGLEMVSVCGNDGMPIFRRWIDAGIATDGACPYCLGKEHEMPRYPM
jgi:hypothetical protein